MTIQQTLTELLAGLADASDAAVIVGIDECVKHWHGDARIAAENVRDGASDAIRRAGVFFFRQLVETARERGILGQTELRERCATKTWHRRPAAPASPLTIREGVNR